MKASDLLAPLKLTEKRDNLELAKRLRQSIDGIMRHAIRGGYIESNPAHDLQGSMATGKAVHRSALPLDRLPELIARIEADSGRPLTRLAVS